jgi:hypothetical protein
MGGFEIRGILQGWLSSSAASMVQRVKCETVCTQGAAHTVFFVGYQGGRTPTGWPHSAIKRTRLPGARGKASPARYA